MKDMSENQWRYIEGFYFKNISTQIQMYDNTKVESVQLGQLLKSSIFVALLLFFWCPQRSPHG